MGPVEGQNARSAQLWLAMTAQPCEVTLEPKLAGYRLAFMVVFQQELAQLCGSFPSRGYRAQ
jgi:hypothetical protein